ncbi:ion channel [Pelobium sp.]|nr:potassium channel family protein [Pelobium sp.]MDA9555262.1 ion channel [Pelobium sp.]
MKSNFGKIIKGDYSFQQGEHSGYKLQFIKIREVWNGKNPDDYGILRIFRLTLVSSLLFFPGVLIDELFRSASSLTRKLMVELYVLIKVAMPLVVLVNKWYLNSFVYYFMIYLLIETYIYLFSKIFLSDQHFKTSTMRTLILLILNFLESGLTFSMIYLAGNYLNITPHNVVDAIYYSFVTSSTIGYGDIYPITREGKLIVVTQILSSISFIVLFFNFFSGKANLQSS